MTRIWCVLPLVALAALYGCDTERDFSEAEAGGTGGGGNLGGSAGSLATSGRAGSAGAGRGGSGAGGTGGGGYARAGSAGRDTAGDAGASPDEGGSTGWSQAGGGEPGGGEPGGGEPSGGEPGGGGEPSGGASGGGPSESCEPDETRSCAEAGLEGPCASGTQTCDDVGTWGECSIPPAAEDTCESGNDANCNGEPNDRCACTPGSTPRPCVGAQGNCALGVEACRSDGSGWSACSIQPESEDKCTPGDDATCDGDLNEGCPCVQGTPQTCGPPAVGICRPGTSTCQADGTWGDCLGETNAGPRSCASAADNDCNGSPDNTVDGTCQCVIGGSRACDTHPQDGTGICKAGTQACTALSGGSASNWSATCTGSVPPKARDCTSTLDNDCNGQPDNTVDTTCQCAVGSARPCETHPQDGTGICKAGSQTCVAASGGAASNWNTCTGSVPPKARACTSSLDNDCNGQPDNTLDTTCQCVIGDTRACGTHPQDGTGICKAGTQTCVAASGGAASNWNTCTGSVAPKARDCASSLDNDCNGQADNTVDGTCKCAIGSTRACGTHPQDGTGICKAGTQTCVAASGGASSDWSTTCTGSVGPKARDCGTALDNDCDGVLDRGTGGPSFVKLPEGYCIDSTEVTRTQYQAWLNTNPSTGGQPIYCGGWNTSYAPTSACLGGSNVCQNNCGSHPQVCVDWCDAHSYCRAVGKRLCGAISGGSIAQQSSTNANLDQWHNACTSHGANTYPYGDSLVDDTCNNYPGIPVEWTSPVASLSGCQSSTAGYTGVFDLSGNVQEWEDSCANPNDNSMCNVRGGWFFDDARSQGLPCAADGLPRPVARNTADASMGFRCCSN